MPLADTTKAVLVFVGWLVVGWLVGWLVAVLVLVLVLCFVGVGVVLIVLVPRLVGWLLCQIGNIQSWGDTEHPRDGTLHVLCSTPQQLNKGAKEQRNKGAKEQKGNEANQEKTSLRRLNDGSPGNSSCHHSNDQ